MLAVIVTYAYRDLWPLATYTENPKDVSEGAMLWAKMTILFATAILIPLFVPTCYAPVDPKVRIMCFQRHYLYSSLL